MPRPPNPEKKVRLSLELSERVRNRLYRLRDETQADSLTEVIRRALVLYDTVVEEQKNGSEIVIRRCSDPERVLRII